MKEKIRKILSIMLTIIFIISIAYIAVYLYTSEQYERSINDIQKIMSDDSEKEGIEFKTHEESDKEEEKENSLITNFKEVQKINTDIVAWIKIEGTNINYPIMQTNNNDYYLYKDYRKQYSRYGSLFLDYRYNFDKENQNFLVYGHNNNDDMMFNDLLKYEDGKFFEENSNITLITDKGIENYKIHFAFKSKAYNVEDKNVFRYYNYIDLSEEEAFSKYISNVSKESIHQLKSDVKFGSKIITLSTCEYSKENGRFVIVGVKE